MRPITLAIPVALLSLVTACGTSSTPVDLTTAPPTTTEPAAQPTAAEPTGAGGSSATGATGEVLTGTLEKTGFAITLTDAKGAPVTTLKAGTYQVKVKDPSTIHNFHLSGPGVEQKTSVTELEEPTWSVTFKAGAYTYECDPHPTNMKKTLTVT